MDDLDLPIWGAAEIGKLINRNKRQVFHLLEFGGSTPPALVDNGHRPGAD